MEARKLLGQYQSSENITKDNIKIKVLGIGGGGNNAVSQMMNSNIKGAEYYLLNTDKEILDRLDEAERRGSCDKRHLRALLRARRRAVSSHSRSEIGHARIERTGFGHDCRDALRSVRRAFHRLLCAGGRGRQSAPRTIRRAGNLFIRGRHAIDLSCTIKNDLPQPAGDRIVFGILNRSA